MNASRAMSRRHLAASPFTITETTVPPTEGYTAGDLVTHDKYGLGTVGQVEEGVALFVDFGSHRQRVAMPCAQLTKL